MTPDERRARMREIIDAHDAAARAFRETAVHFKGTTVALNEAYARMEQSLARIEAISIAISTANRAALALWNDDEPNPSKRTE